MTRNLFRVLAQAKVAIYLDAGAYPIARWGIECAAARGVPVHTFAHHNAGALARRLRHDARHGLKPVVVADGFCPGCSRSAPIASYLNCVRRSSGYLVVDDTQALGILGKGGGGSLRWRQISSPHVMIVSSLAKGFGVPVAVLAGSRSWLKYFEAKSETRVHTSPPSSVMFHAAEHALSVNQARGDALRLRLTRLVHRFRQRLASYGLSTTGELFPVQTLQLRPDVDARLVHKHLLDLRIRTVLHRPRCKRHAAISLLITALHRFADVERAAGAIAEAVKYARQQTRTMLERGYESARVRFRTV